MIILTQFETTFWVKHKTPWQWNKILKIMTLVWRMQMWKSWRKMLKSWTNVTNVTLPLLAENIWGHIWKHTVEKSQTNATSVIMHLFTQVPWRIIWKSIFEETFEDTLKWHMEITRKLTKHSMWINECDKMIYHGTEMEQETKNVFSFCLSECEWETKEIVLLLCRLITLSGQGSGDLIWGEGRGWKIPPLTESTLALPLPKKWSPTSYLAKTKMFQQKNNQKVACNMHY